MVNKLIDGFIKAFYIAKKDAKVYYFKAPNFTYGFLIPVSLFLAFSIAGQINSTLVVSGLTSLVILFGTTSIEAVAVVLEKQTGTFERLLVAPVSLFTILFGKALAGFFFGLVLAALTLIPLAAVSGITIANPVLVFFAIGFSAFAFSALGVLVSAYAKWVPEAQMLSNFLRFPMAFLSGTFVPIELMPTQVGFVARFLPLTYSVETMRISINDSAPMVNYLLDILVLALFAFILLVVATKVLQRRLE